MGLLSKLKKSKPEAPSPPISEAAPAPPPEAAAGDVLEALRAKIVELSGGQLTLENVDPAGALFDDGYIDSLSAAKLIAFIDQQYGVEITELDLVGELFNLGALARSIEERR
jgi:acyl carrier protein